MISLPQIQIDPVFDDDGEPRIELSWVAKGDGTDVDGQGRPAPWMRKLMALFQEALDHTVEGEELSTCIALMMMEREGAMRKVTR